MEVTPDLAVEEPTASRAERPAANAGASLPLQTVAPGSTPAATHMSDSATRQIVREEVWSALGTFRPEPLSADERNRVLIQIMPRVQRYVEELVDARLQEKLPSISEPATTGPAMTVAVNKNVPDVSEHPPQPNNPRAQREVSEDAAQWIALAKHGPSATKEEDVHPSQWKGPPQTGLEERQPLNIMFRQAVSYRTYRLRRRDRRYDASIADKIGDLAKRLKPSMQCPNFSGEDEIAVLGFLKNYKRACDDTGTTEGMALPLLRYFLTGEALSTFLSYIGPGLRNSQPGVDCIKSYPEAIQWLLNNYARDAVLSEAHSRVIHLCQGPTETESQFGIRLRVEALRCGDIFDERTLIAMYVDGLKAYTRHIVREAISQNPRMTFQALKSMAQSYGDSHREDRQSAYRTRPSAKNNLAPRRTIRTDAFIGEPVGDMELYALPVDTAAPLETSLPTTGSPPISIPSSPGRSTNTSVTSTGSPFPRKYTLRCYGCKEVGHGIPECPLLTEEQRAIFLRAHNPSGEGRTRTTPPNQKFQGLRRVAADVHKPRQETAPVLSVTEGMPEDSKLPQGKVDGGEHLGLSSSVRQEEINETQ